MVTFSPSLFLLCAFWFFISVICFLHLVFLYVVVLLVLQRFGGKRSYGRTQERFSYQRHIAFCWPIPQHQARKYSCCWSRQVPSHGISLSLSLSLSRVYYYYFFFIVINSEISKYRFKLIQFSQFDEPGVHLLSICTDELGLV